MLYQGIVIAGLVIFMLNLTLNLRSLRTLRPDAKAPEPAPLVSVLIPARDEEANIAACLESLQKQDYPNFEILVLDDNSSDNTSAVVEAMAAQDSRIRLIRGEPLPEDWAGKPFACYQLAKQARGSWLLFVDADTIHAPHMLRSTLAWALETKCSLLSGFPRQLANSLPPEGSHPGTLLHHLQLVPPMVAAALKQTETHSGHRPVSPFPPGGVLAHRGARRGKVQDNGRCLAGD